MFASVRTAPRKESKSPGRSREEDSQELYRTQGYSCTLYKDYLVFYGGKWELETINTVCVYNLKEKRVERNQARNERNMTMPKISHSACLYERGAESMIIFFGGQGADTVFRRSKDPMGFQNLALQINAEGDGVEWLLDQGIPGPDMPSPVSNVYQDKLYHYQPGEVNANFGSLQVYDILRANWMSLIGIPGNERPSEPSGCAIFCDNNLYLFTENEERSNRKGSESEKIFEDVYVLEIVNNETNPRWRRVSAEGQVPGLLSNVSMTAANGIIYIFGSKLVELGGESKTVLWTYDTGKETWREVRDIGTLTAGPNQRAVVYKDQLLIVDWSYPPQSVNIQYQSLNNLVFISPSTENKQLCKDQPDSFIQHCKNLYNGRLFADIIFEVQGEEISAHKAILVYRSDYFMKMFTSGMSESYSHRISIPNMKSHIFKAILQYMYCNEIELDEQLALDLIPVVDEYLMKGLKGLCEKYLCKQLRRDNVVDMLILADRHEIEELKKACFRFILKDLGNIDENEEMMKLSKSLFIELLKFNTSGSQSSSKKNDEEEEKSNVSDVHAFGGFGVPTKGSTSNLTFNSQGGYMTKQTALFSTGTKAPRKASRSRS